MLISSGIIGISGCVRVRVRGGGGSVNLANIYFRKMKPNKIEKQPTITTVCI